MSDQSPAIDSGRPKLDAGGQYGAQGDPYQPEKPLFGVDFSQPPADILGMGYTGHNLDEHLNDRQFKLDFNWSNHDAENKSKDLERRDLLDGTVLGRVLESQRKHDAMREDISRRMDAFMSTLNQPYPVREIAKMDWADEIAGGLGMAMGVRADRALGGVQQIEQQRADVDYTNRLNQFNLDRETRLMKLQQMQTEFNQAAVEGREIDQDVISEYQRLETQAHEDEKQKQVEIEKARDRLSKATSPAEVDQEAIHLKGLGVPVDDKTLQGFRDAASLKMQEEGRKQLTDLQKSLPLNPSQQMIDQTQASIDAISQQYKLPMVKGPDGQMHGALLIPGSLPWKAQLEKDKQDFLEKYRREQLRIAAKNTGIKSMAAANLVALHQAEINFLNQRPGIAYAQIAEATDKNVRGVDRALAFAQGKLSEIGSQIAQVKKGIDPSTGKSFESTAGSPAVIARAKRLRDLQAEYGRQVQAVQGYRQARKVISSTIDTSGGAAALGGPTLTPGDGGTTVYDEGGVTITKH